MVYIKEAGQKTCIDQNYLFRSTLFIELKYVLLIRQGTTRKSQSLPGTRFDSQAENQRAATNHRIPGQS
jgi:hypothetical protein